MKISAAITVIAIACTAVVGCGDDVTGPDRPTGTFVLTSMAGAPIPALFVSPEVPGVDEYAAVYRSGSLTFHGDSGTYRLHIEREWPRGTFTDLMIEETGAVKRAGPGRI